MKPLSFKSATVHIFEELKETISKVLKRGMMTTTHQIENINKEVGNIKILELKSTVTNLKITRVIRPHI